MPKITKLRKLLLDTPQPMYKTAGQMGIHSSTMCRYALGRKDIPPHHLIIMSRYWQLDPREIIGYLEAEDIVRWLDDNEKEHA